MSPGVLPELTVEHNGYVNGTAALGYLAEHYPDATQVVVVGKSNGAIAAPLHRASPPTCFPTPRSRCSAAKRVLFRTTRT